MVRRIVVGILALVGVVASGWALMRRSGGDRASRDSAVQWPFDKDELRTLMTRVVDEQRKRVDAIEGADGRTRARAFLTYYERRRNAATA